MQKLKQKREGALQSINAMVVAAKGKQLDATVFCERSRPLSAADGAMMAYMEKNKDWCQIPDEVVDQFKAVREKDIGFAAKACNVAAQMKKMKDQAAQGSSAPQAQPLPTGPL